MGQIIGNALSSGNYRTMASVARSQGRAQQAAYNLKANNLEEEARADSRLASLNMSRMRENQASNQASARARQASSGFAAEGSSMQNELALADVFEKSIADMALSNALSDSGKRTAAMASRQQGRLSMMQADAQAGQYNPSGEIRPERRMDSGGFHPPFRRRRHRGHSGRNGSPHRHGGNKREGDGWRRSFGRGGHGWHHAPLLAHRRPLLGPVRL